MERERERETGEREGGKTEREQKTFFKCLFKDIILNYTYIHLEHVHNIIL